MAPHGKELSEDLKKRIVALHDDSQGYKKIANTLKLSCNTVAKIIQRFKRAGSTQNRPQVGRPILPNTCKFPFRRAFFKKNINLVLCLCFSFLFLRIIRIELTDTGLVEYHFNYYISKSTQSLE